LSTFVPWNPPVRPTKKRSAVMAAGVGGRRGTLPPRSMSTDQGTGPSIEMPAPASVISTNPL
jgi:hypothetical protein